MLVCLPVCGFVSGNRARPREMADSRVLATARHIHICLRVAVLHDSSHFRRFRPAAAPTVTALGTSGRVRRVKSALGFATVPHGDAPASFARHSRRDAASHTLSYLFLGSSTNSPAVIPYWDTLWCNGSPFPLHLHMENLGTHRKTDIYSLYVFCKV